MATKKTFVKDLETVVLSRDPARMEKLFSKPEAASTSPEEILKALTAGMERARAELKEGRRSIPEFLLSLDAFRKGVECLKAKKGEVGGTGATVVIGVVEGDVHDMGKNIVAGVLEAAGYRVHDLGKDVPRDRFLEALEQTRAPLVALSTMMSTPIENMRDVVRWVRKLHPDVKILVGGAPLDARLARAIGADGYAEGAPDVPAEVERVLGPRGRAVAVEVPAAAK